MRIYNPFTKKFKTVTIAEQNMEHYKFETRKVGSRMEIMRVWYDGWFPINPVKGYDIKSKDWGKEYHQQSKILAVNYKG